MAISRKRMHIGDADRGIYLTALTDNKLKTNNFIVHFMTRLTEENAAANASAAFLLEDTCAEYPDITSFNRHLAELYGAAIRGGVSRFYDNQVITFSGGCIADKYALNGEEISYEVLKLLCGCIFEPVTENGIFPEKQFLLKKQELIDDIDADINDKRSYAIKQARTIIYKNEPSGLAVKGERQSAEALAPEQSFKAYKALLRSARIEIIFVGRELPDKCVSLLEEKFGALERENICYPDSKPSPVKAEPEYVTERLDVVQSKMVMAFKHDISGKYCHIARIFNAVFGATPFSMLFKNVREKMSLCYYCSSSFVDEKHTVFVDSGVESSNIEAARSEILNQLEQVKSGNFSDEIFEQSKLYVICALKGVNDAPRTAADWYFDQCLDSEEETLSPEEYIEKIKSVTRKDVQDFARSLTLDAVYVLTGKED